MAITKITINGDAVRQLLLSAEVTAELVRRARAIEAAAGAGHRVEVSPTAKRARVVVITDTIEARRGEAYHHNLTRAVGAGRAG